MELLRAKAAEMGLPMTRLAMAWVLSNQDVDAMLVGADNAEQLDEAMPLGDATSTRLCAPRCPGGAKADLM